MIADLPTKGLSTKRYRSDKRLSEFYLQDGNENQLAYIIMDEFTSLSPYV